MDFREQPYFHYEALDKTKDSFRLVKLLPGDFGSPIECKIIHKQISAHADCYNAISYTWGKPGSVRWIRLNGTPFLVQPNLFAALKAIRRQDVELVIWADALCIDQRQILERNHQVSQMGNIYKNAKEVFAWLGPAVDDSDMLLDHAQRYPGDSDDQYHEGDEQLWEITLPNEDKQLVSLALTRFLERGYWRRAWIVQEIILAKRFTIYCGSRKVDGFRLFQFAVDDGLDDPNKHLPIVKVFANRQSIRYGGSDSLATLLTMYSQTECKDPRDRVFSLLALASDCQSSDRRTADYTLGRPALFFWLLAISKRDDILSLAAVFQNALAVQASELLTFWDKVPPRNECPRSSNSTEMVAIAFVWAVRRHMNVLNFETWKISPEAEALASRRKIEYCSLDMWLTRCSLYADFMVARKDIMFVEFETKDFCLVAFPSLFGLMFQAIYEKAQHPAQSETEAAQPLWQLYSRSLDEALAKDPFISASEDVNFFDVAARIEGSTFGGLDAALTFNEGLKFTEKQPVILVCSFLLEFKKRKGFICIEECRYQARRFGHKLLEARG